MVGDIEKGLKSKDPLIRQTVTGSFKYGASKQTESIALEMIITDLSKLILDADVNVQKAALEATMTITHNHSRVVAHDLEKLLQAAQS